LYIIARRVAIATPRYLRAATAAKECIVML
jgi:hypothetical protein